MGVIKNALQIFFITAIILAGFTTCDMKDEDDFEDDIEVLGDGLVSVRGHDILLIENSNTSSDLWIIAGDRAGEGFGALVDRNNTEDSVTLYGTVCATPNGNSFVLLFDERGYPSSMIFNDNSTITITNYTSSTADISLIDPNSSIPLATETVELGEDFEKLQNLIAEYGLTFDTSGSLNNLVCGDRTIIHGYANEARLTAIKGILKIVGTSISVLGCAVTASTLLVPGTQPVSAPLTAAACVSAGSGVFSTIDYFLGKSDEGDSAGGMSTVLSGIGCFGNPRDCPNFLMAMFESYIPDCMVATRHDHKGCIDKTLYWYNDCNILQETVAHCEYGCTNGECVPFETNMRVTIIVDPPCVHPGDTVFFSSQVSGGDSSTYSYTWDFGGSSGYLDSGSQTFTDAGLYEVMLTVEDESGNKGWSYIELEVGDCDDIRAGISVTPLCVDTGKNISFSAKVTGGDNSSYKYSWNLGDGNISTGPQVVHSYGYEKQYTVSLVVSDRNNLMDKVETSVQVGSCDEPGNDDTDTSESTTSTISEDDAGTTDDNDNDGYSEAQDDCDDTDASIHPGALEVCDDGVDNDCNDKTDCDDSACEEVLICGQEEPHCSMQGTGWVRVDTNGDPSDDTYLLCSYHANKQLGGETPYTDGKRNGVEISYYESGQLRSETPYTDDKRGGVGKFYYESGQIQYETPYTDDKRNGVSKTYYESGQIRFETPYTDDKINGVSKEYYESGQVQHERTYTDNILNGEAKDYDDEGNLTHCFVWVDGARTESCM